MKLGRLRNRMIPVKQPDRVFHLYPEAIDPDPEIYPRHFGMTFQHRAEFDQILERAKAADLVFFKEPFIRFEGRPDEQGASGVKVLLVTRHTADDRKSLAAVQSLTPIPSKSGRSWHQ